MNSALATQRDNTRFFFLSLAVSIFMLIAAGFFVLSMLAGNYGNLDASARACLSSMRTNGFNPTLKDNNRTVTVLQAMTTNIEPQVYKSGVILAHCPAFKLVDYCAGTKCAVPGVSFTLERK